MSYYQTDTMAQQPIRVPAQPQLLMHLRTRTWTQTDSVTENEEYLTRQLITYIGNKRALLGFINNGISIVINRLKKKRLDIFDVFSGSGIVSRFMKKYAKTLIANDMEKYAEIISRCYLANVSELDFDYLKQAHEYLEQKLYCRPLKAGFITEIYAPQNDGHIREGERVFYTRRNALFIDSARQHIGELDKTDQHFFLGPLLSEASIHANTSGVFKGFYKNSETGKGQFGGNNRDALTRILGNIRLPFPIFSDFDCDVRICRGDANNVAEYVNEVDIAYLDPPYNQHPYGSNYFMLNLIADYKKPENISEVSGIPPSWNRSAYNKKETAYTTFASLIERIKAKFLLISFNSEGFIRTDEMISLLRKAGKVQVLETDYNTFRGSRNLANRDIHLKEYLYLVEKK